ncbi:MAG TPA: thioredoxin family protein [Chloroflexota bacterium]|jgi:thioredoxin 1
MHEVSRASYQDDVVAASLTQPVLVDCWGPRCGPCLAMMPWVERLAEELASTVRIVKLNSAENRRLCVELRVMSLPTFLLYRDGEVVRRLTGESCTPSTISAALRESVAELAQAPALSGV